MHLYTSAAPSHMGSFVCYQYCIQSVNSHQAQASPRMHSAPGTCFIQDTLCTGHMLYTGCTLHQVQTFHRMYCAPDTCFAQDAFCTRCVLCTGYPLHTACALHRVPPCTRYMLYAECPLHLIHTLWRIHSWRYVSGFGQIYNDM